MDVGIVEARQDQTYVSVLALDLKYHLQNG
jgi:hypothetical protein